MRLALRQLLKSPGFTLVAVLTVAVGIGANTALFSIFNRLVLSPLDLPEPRQLVRVWANNPGRNLLAPVMSVPKYELFSNQQQSFAGFAASFINGFLLTRDGAEAEQLPALQVTAGWIPTLGLSLLHGRNFAPEEDAPGGGRVVILTEECWRTRFGAAEQVLGTRLLLSGTPHTVIGVLRGPLPSPVAFAQLVVPRALDGVGLTPEQIRGGASFLSVTARLKPGADFRQADSEVRALGRRYQDAFPANLDAAHLNELRSWIDEITGDTRRTVAVLLVAVGLVLFIACANVANLFLSRLTTRQREIAVRLSLGATRGALVRQFLLEAALFCALAAGLGLLLAVWSLDGVEKLAVDRLPAGTRFPLDGLTLAFTAGISILTACAIGLLPALQASRVNVSDALKDSARGATGSARGGHFRAGLVVVEVALSVLLLIGSGLLLLSFLRLQSTSPGFEPRGAAIAAINTDTANSRTPAQQLALLDRLLDGLRAQPQIAHVAAGSSMPAGFLRDGSRLVYAVRGRPVPTQDKRPSAAMVIVSEDYFRALGVPLQAGRFFTRDDRADTAGVAIVNESFAKKLFPGGNAVGQALLRGPRGETVHEIVGVVADLKSQGLNTPAPDTIYLSLRQVPRPFVSIVARLAAPEPREGAVEPDPAALQTVFRSVAAATERGMPVTLFQTLDSALASSLGVQRLVAWCTAVFAGLALLLAMLGLYAVLAHAVTQRTSEIGIRMALGATRGQVLALVLHHGMKLVAIGLVAGLTLAAGAAQLMRALLFEVRPLDPVVYVTVTALFAAVAGLACLLPARRATRVDPLTALRSE